MSTILDALRRAEAERARPAGTQPLPPVSMPAAPAPPRRGPGLLAGLLLLLAAGGGLLYLGLPKPPAGAQAQAPMPAASPAAATPPPALPVLLEAPGARVLPAPAPSPAPAAASAALPPRAEASAPQPAPAQRPPRLGELPAALRQQLPPLQLGGSMYSPDARLRSLILNGQLYREGDSPAPGLELLEIQPRHALLRFRGQVFELGL